MITVACVFVKGHVPFTMEYVTHLRSMVRRHLHRPHRFVCFTDRPQYMRGDIEPIEIPKPHKVKGWWSKLELFNQAHGLTGRVLYLDLDTLIVSSLDPIVDFPAPFALIPHSGNFDPGSSITVKRFNSSVMVWNAGVNASLYDGWTPAVAKRLHGDQDFIGEQMPEAATMPLSWFPRLSELKSVMPTPPAKVVLCKVPKNSVAADLYPWVNDTWRAA